MTQTKQQHTTRVRITVTLLSWFNTDFGNGLKHEERVRPNIKRKIGQLV